MTPTTRFRYIERQINICTSLDGTVSHGTMVRILQQWWDNDIQGWNAPGEWRDVPLEEEA